MAEMIRGKLEQRKTLKFVQLINWDFKESTSDPRKWNLLVSYMKTDDLHESLMNVNCI